MAIDRVRLGGTGLKVSELALGTWRFGRHLIDGEERYDGDGIVEIPEDRAYELLDAYADAGGRFIDTADKYGDGRAEQWIGNWLEGRDRLDYVIGTKVYFPRRLDTDDPNARGLNRRHIRQQIDNSLERLGTDYVDILFCHRWDDRTPPEEFMRTLNSLVEDGKVSYLGMSSDTPDAWKIVKANEIARRYGYEPFTVTQPRYNLVDRSIDINYLPMCRDYGMGAVTWSPLAWGFLTGKYRRDETEQTDSIASRDDRFSTQYLLEENFEALDVLLEVADDVGATPAQVAIAWQLHHPDVSVPIIGASSVSQLNENLEAASVSMSDEQFERLSAAKTASIG